MVINFDRGMNKSNIKLTEEQILILQLSDKDIDSDKLISQVQLDKNDLFWLKIKFKINTSPKDKVGRNKNI